MHGEHLARMTANPRYPWKQKGTTALLSYPTILEK